MRKRIISQDQQDITNDEQQWLNIDELAEVELTSEDVAHPIESALLHSGETSGWRASTPGKQIIRFLFTKPQHIQRILLGFVETQVERTQEFVLRWSADGGKTFQEIVRQQWNFSAQGATSEMEDYNVNLLEATVLEIIIVPDISNEAAYSTLAKLRLG